MKKIGFLFGEDDSFPLALIDEINKRNPPGIKAEIIKIGAIKVDDLIGYNVIFDRVSYEVNFYNSILKLAILEGVKVINNPFWNIAEDNFFQNVISNRMKINVPRTVILPTKEHAPGTTSKSYRNLIYPLNWDDIFNYVQFPAILKPNIENSSHIFIKVYNKNEFFTAYDMTGNTVMLLQEFIDYEEYYRCYVVGKKRIKIIQYDPSLPQHLRFTKDPVKLDNKLAKKLEDMSIKICSSLGFDFNVVEFAVKQGQIFAVEFINKFPLTRNSYLHPEHFSWLIMNTADYLIELARQRKVKPGNYSWINFLGIEKPSNRKNKSL